MARDLKEEHAVLTSAKDDIAKEISAIQSLETAVTQGYMKIGSAHHDIVCAIDSKDGSIILNAIDEVIAIKRDRLKRVCQQLMERV